MKRLMLWILISVWLVGCQPSTPHTFVKDDPQNPLEEVSGSIFQFGEYKGKWIIVNYWASWCEPCRKEIPELVKLLGQRPDVVVVGVNFDFVDSGQIAKLGKTLGITYPVLITDPAVNLGVAPIEVLPTTFVINPEGEVIARLVGEQTAQSLNKLLKPMSNRVAS